MKRISFCGHFQGNKKCYFTQTSFRKTEANFFADFSPPLFLFLCFSLPHIWAVSVTLFYSAKRNPTKNISSNSHTNKKKNVIWLFKKLGRYKRASFCVSSVLFIYLKGCTLYQFTLPHSLRHRLGGSEVKRINYFFIIIYLSAERERKKETERVRGGG